MATIVILEHREQQTLKRTYLVHVLARYWREQGHTVLTHHGTTEPPAGDLAIANIDLTEIPPAYAALFARYPRVVNARVLDISKRSYSTLQLAPTDAWDGAVIVKTNRNFGGQIDAYIRQRTLRAGRAAEFPPVVMMKDYALLDAMRDVPPEVWANEGLIVERFVPECDADGYYMRVWVFFGDQERSFRMRAGVPLIKSHDVLDREPVAVPAAIRHWRERLGFDYGKFDYVVRDGEALLIDANRTPGAPAGHDTDTRIAAGLSELSGGLEALLA